MTPHGKQAKPASDGRITIHQRFEPASADDDGPRVYELPNGERLVGWEWSPDRPDEPPWPVTDWEAAGFGPQLGEDGTLPPELQGFPFPEGDPEDQDDEVAKDEDGTEAGPRFVIDRKSPIIGLRFERPVSGEGTAGEGAATEPDEGSR